MAPEIGSLGVNLPDSMGSILAGLGMVSPLLPLVQELLALIGSQQLPDGQQMLKTKLV